LVSCFYRVRLNETGVDGVREGSVVRRPVARVRFKTSNGRKRGMRGIGTGFVGFFGLVCFTTTDTTQSRMGVYEGEPSCVKSNGGI
jgi:hypothetical protein